MVYFFACHDAPFAVLSHSKLTPWEDGFQDEFDLGKIAKGAGKARSQMFEEALQIARVEYDKPIDMRLDWNHPSVGTIDGEQMSANRANLPLVACPYTKKRKQKEVCTSSDIQVSLGSEIPCKNSGRTLLESPKKRWLVEDPIVQKGHGTSACKPGSLLVSHRENLHAALKYLSVVSNEAAEIEQSDAPLYCKLLAKEAGKSDVQANIGFVVLLSRT